MDYSELSNDEMNLRVAERLGWKEVTTVDRMPTAQVPYSHSVVGLPPDGDGRVMRFGDYEGNLKEAFVLMEMVRRTITPRLVRILVPMGDHMEFVWKAVFAASSSRGSWSAEHERPARAICLAFLEMTDEFPEAADEF